MLCAAAPAGGHGFAGGDAAGAATPAAPGAAAPADCDATLLRFEETLRRTPDDLLRGSDYRRAVIRCAAYDRGLDLFAELTAAHPGSAPALLNHGYAYVDKIPTVGAVTRVLHANAALALFTRAVEVEASWLALYTRGNSYLYWPKSLGRVPLAVADLERAAAIARAGPPRPYQLRGWIALGDAYWKSDRQAEAGAAWQEGLERFPGEPRLQARLAGEGEALATLIEGELDPRRRVDTDLSVLAEPPP